MDDIEAFEARRWEHEGWSASRERYADQLKGQQAGLTTKRLATFAWVESIVGEVTRAYEALEIEPHHGEGVGGLRMAAQLSRQGVRTQRRCDPIKLRDRGKAWANALVHEMDASMIDEAVLEARTLMTARCLSADFASVDLGSLEEEYIKIIMSIIKLGRELRNQAPLSEDDLRTRARLEAIEAARRQRSDKPPISMASRERYWQDRPAPVQKLFECRHPIRWHSVCL